MGLLSLPALHLLLSSVGQKKVGVFGMVVIGFFWVHGGIYGNEAMLMAGPPLYVFVMLSIVPFVYSLPIALIVAELSTAFPEDGGYVVWVREACGKVVGSHHAYWVWVIYVVDAAVYPVLVANYVDTMVPMGETARGLLAVGIIVGVACINLAGTDVMVKFSTLLFVMSLLPTLAFTLLGLPSVNVASCVVAEGPVDWSLLVSWVLWLYCGFFSLGTLAGELERPKHSYIVSIAVLFPAVLLLNTLPLAVALGIDPDASHYSAGYFNVLARRLAGSWLDWGFQLGANVCLIGLYNAAVLTAERSLAFLVNSHYSEAIARLAAGSTGGPFEHASSSRSTARRLKRLLGWLLTTGASGVAPLYIVLNAVCAAVLVWMPYTILVEFSMLLSVPSILLFMWAFVALRVQQPHVERPFVVPGGLTAAVLITVVPVAISVAYGAIVITESFMGPSASHELSESQGSGLPPIFQLWSMLAVMTTGLVVHGVGSLCESHQLKQASIEAAGAKQSDGAELQAMPLTPSSLPNDSEPLRLLDHATPIDGGGRERPTGKTPLSTKIRCGVGTVVTSKAVTKSP